MHFVPENEQGVIISFALQAQDTQWEIEHIQTRFPDAIIKDKRTNALYAAEFEYKASSFVLHEHDIDQCDVIVCWFDDWPDCPITVWSMQDWSDKTLVAKSHLDKIESLREQVSELEDECASMQRWQEALRKDNKRLGDLLTQYQDEQWIEAHQKPYTAQELAYAILSAHAGEGRPSFRARFDSPPGANRARRLMAMAREIIDNMGRKS